VKEGTSSCADSCKILNDCNHNSYETVPELELLDDREEKATKGSIQWVMDALTKAHKPCFAALKRWVNRGRRNEISDTLVQDLLSLEPALRQEALRELKKPKSWIRRVNQNSVFIPVQIQTLDD
jgi:hypothetical protein